MYACLHTLDSGSTEELVGLALRFSPFIEKVSENTVLFSIAPLRKLIGSPHQIASEICCEGYARNLQANLAVAANCDAAILLPTMPAESPW